MGCLLGLLKALHWINNYLMPRLIQLIIHRKILEKVNLIAAPQEPGRRANTSECPMSAPKFRPDDGYGTDVKNPYTATTGYAIGRNMDTVPKEQRNPMGAPDVQLVSQRLLAREGFTPAGDQLNIIAAAWIQAQVHGWIGHMNDEERKVTFDKDHGCPMKEFTAFATLERPDGHFDSERSQWWDASFVYGQNKAQIEQTRSFSGGKLKVNKDDPDNLSEAPDGTYNIGDKQNSWVGITLLQNLFLKEHNWICDHLASEYPDLSDDELFGHARNIIAAINAKIHTVDWTCELLKTKQLEIGMKTNWYGLTKAIFGKKACGSPLKLVEKKKANNRGVPFSLTEEFAAVYRLHPLCPPGVVLDVSDEEAGEPEFVTFENLLNAEGRKVLNRDGMPLKMMKSMYEYPCGHLVGANYPDALREVEPTDESGKDRKFRIDLAAIDLYRDRERGIQSYNNFRRLLSLKPFKKWIDMTGDEQTAKKLEIIYGPAPQGIEKCDLLVGDLYEKKIKGFAISETSFIVFLLMASRRLDADPFLNELFDAEHYTEFGIQHVKEVNGIRDLLERHYPDIAAPFVERKQSAFKPIYGPEKWKEAVDKGIVDPALVKRWEETKKANEEFFKTFDL